MLCYIIFCYILLYYIIFCYSILCYIIFYYMILYKNDVVWCLDDGVKLSCKVPNPAPERPSLRGCPGCSSVSAKTNHLLMFFDWNQAAMLWCCKCCTRFHRMWFPTCAGFFRTFWIQVNPLDVLTCLRCIWASCDARFNLRAVRHGFEVGNEIPQFANSLKRVERSDT